MKKKHNFLEKFIICTFKEMNSEILRPYPTVVDLIFTELNITDISITDIIFTDINIHAEVLSVNINVRNKYVQ